MKATIFGNRFIRIASVGLLAGCLMLGCAKPQLAKRYRNTPQLPDINSIGYATVSAFVTDVPAASALPALQGLSPQGQGELIKAIGKDKTSNEQLMRDLGRRFTSQSSVDGSGVIDRTRVTRRLIITIQRNELNTRPADRMVAARITLDGLQGARFVAWDKFETQYDQVDIANLTRKGTDQFKAGLSVGPAVGAATPASGTLGYTGTNELTEVVKLRQRRVLLSGQLMAKKAVLFQEGTYGIDLVGNTAIDVTIELEGGKRELVSGFIFGPLRKAGDWLAPDDVTYRAVQLRLPSWNANKPDVTVGIGGQYVIRHVTYGDETFPEGDDKVIFNEGDFTTIEGLKEQRYPGAVILVDANDVRQRGMYWVITEGGTQSDPRLRFAESRMDLVFHTYNAATMFMEWLLADPGNRASVNGAKLVVLGSRVDAAMIANLQVTVVVP